MLSGVSVDDPQRTQALMRMDALSNVDDGRLREAIIEALRRQCRPPFPIDRSLLVEDVLQQVTGLTLEERRATALGFNGVYAVFLQHRGSAPRGENEDIRRVETILWELISRGLFYPRLGPLKYGVHEAKHAPHGIQYLVATALGERFLLERRLHPPMPDFVPRSTSGLASLPTEVTSALEDAQQCFHERLLRASVVMLGLAFEAMASAILDVIVRGTKPMMAKDILAKIEEAVRRTGGEAGLQAVRVAEQIRMERNEAAHRWSLDFSDLGRVETLLILGGRNVAPFWTLHE